jgi:hypothetical protein
MAEILAVKDRVYLTSAIQLLKTIAAVLHPPNVVYACRHTALVDTIQSILDHSEYSSRHVHPSHVDQASSKVLRRISASARLDRVADRAGELTENDLFCDLHVAAVSILHALVDGGDSSVLNSVVSGIRFQRVKRSLSVAYKVLVVKNPPPQSLASTFTPNRRQSRVRTECFLYFTLIRKLSDLEMLGQLHSHSRKRLCSVPGCAFQSLCGAFCMQHLFSDCPELEAYMMRDTGAVEILNDGLIQRIFFPIPSNVYQLPRRLQQSMQLTLADISRDAPEQKSKDLAVRIKQVAQQLRSLLECISDTRRSWAIRYTSNIEAMCSSLTILILFLVYLFYGSLDDPWAGGLGHRHQSVQHVVRALGALHCALGILRVIAYIVMHRSAVVADVDKEQFMRHSLALRATIAPFAKDTQSAHHHLADKAMDLILEYIQNSGASMAEVMWQLDKSGDGQLDVQELCRGLAQLGVNLDKSLFPHIMQIFDPDGAGPSHLLTGV